MKFQTFGNDLDSPDALRMQPVKKYSAPGYPTYSDAANNATLLKKLPSRWQANAKVIACIGMLGTATLAGCNTNQCDVCTPDDVIVKNVIGDNHAKVRIHYGGAGGAGYVVYLSEMEALSIIRSEAEAVGLKIHETPFVEYKRFSTEIEKSYTNAFAIYPDTSREGDRALRDTMYSRSFRTAFLKSENDGAGVSWKEFLRLLKNPQGNARVRMHHGGFSGTPFYVVYVTEQEALSAIHAEAKAAELNLISTAEQPVGVSFRELKDPNALVIKGPGLEGLEKGENNAGKAFRSDEADGIPWEEFLKILNEQKEAKKP